MCDSRSKSFPDSPSSIAVASSLNVTSSSSSSSSAVTTALPKPILSEDLKKILPKLFENNLMAIRYMSQQDQKLTFLLGEYDKYSSVENASYSTNSFLPSSSSSTKFNNKTSMSSVAAAAGSSSLSCSSLGNSDSSSFSSFKINYMKNIQRDIKKLITDILNSCSVEYFNTVLTNLSDSKSETTITSNSSSSSSSSSDLSANSSAIYSPFTTLSLRGTQEDPKSNTNNVSITQKTYLTPISIERGKDPILNIKKPEDNDIKEINQLYVYLENNNLMYATKIDVNATLRRIRIIETIGNDINKNEVVSLKKEYCDSFRNALNDELKETSKEATKALLDTTLKKGDTLRLWKLVFGETFCIMSYLLTEKDDQKRSSILLHSSDITLNDFQRIELKRAYNFFLKIINENKINCNILLDRSAAEALDIKEENKDQSVILGNMVNIIENTSKTNSTKPYEVKETSNSVANNFNDRSFLSHEKETYLVGIKKEYLSKKVMDLWKEKNGDPYLDLSQQIITASPNNWGQKRTDFLAFPPIQGAAVILTLRQEGHHSYDSNNPPFCFTTKSFISHVISALSQYNKDNPNNKVQNIFIIGNGYNNQDFFKTVVDEQKISPRDFINSEIKNNKLESQLSVFLTTNGKNLGKEIYDRDELQYLAFACCIIHLKNNYNVQFAIGPNTGLTHLLALFGVPIVFPTDKDRFIINYETNYFPIEVKGSRLFQKPGKIAIDYLFGKPALGNTIFQKKINENFTKIKNNDKNKNPSLSAVPNKMSHCSFFKCVALTAASAALYIAGKIIHNSIYVKK